MQTTSEDSTRNHFLNFSSLPYLCNMILVTGGTGFVGSHLLYHLVKDGKRVNAIKRSSSSMMLIQKVFSSKNAENLFENINWIEADVLDIFSLIKAFEGISEVYHAAAAVSFDPAGKKLMMQTNVEGTANVVNAALEKKLRKLCFISSIAALGRTPATKPIDEDTHFSSSVNPSTYSISKYESEREIWRGIHEGLNAVIVNPSVILGLGDWNNGSSKLFQTVYDKLMFYTTGSNGFVDVNDVAKAMVLLMESDLTNDRFIISAENLKYKQLFSMIAEALKVPPPRYKAGVLLSAAYWRALKAKALITGKQPLVTKETAHTAQQHSRYNNSKFLNQFDFSYVSIQQSIKQAAEIFLEEQTEKA